MGVVKHQTKIYFSRLSNSVVPSILREARTPSYKLFDFPRELAYITDILKIGKTTDTSCVMCLSQARNFFWSLHVSGVVRRKVKRKEGNADTD